MRLLKIIFLKLIFLILTPFIKFLIDNSTIFPLFVLGISETAKILLGTCFGERLFLISNFIFFINSSSNLFDSFILTNNITSVSEYILCSTATHSLMLSMFSTIR